MKDIVLKIEDVSKQYRLGEVGTGTLSHDLNRWWHLARGKDDPYTSVGAVNDRSLKANEDYVWALQDINLDVCQGEVIGIVGKNGAGKSTLLKLLSQVTNPTTGYIGIKGRIASLLEVGTGFHPELTGRDNIFLNGSILGMTKGEIRSKLEQIVDFAGVAKYIDTPVKRYSSGMKVRLGFAVAAHLEPEILVVDEVLAVGDAEFQRKAIGKMQDVAKGEGRTVLFVSHNMSSVRNLCNKGVLLENGRISYVGDVDETIDHYLQGGSAQKVHFVEFDDMPLPIQFKKIALAQIVEFSEDVEITMDIKVNEPNPDYTLGFIVFDSKANCVAVSTYDEYGLKLIDQNHLGEIQINATFQKKLLKPGTYSIRFTARTINGEAIHTVEDTIFFDVRDTHTYRGLKGMYRPRAIIAPEVQWKKLN